MHKILIIAEKRTAGTELASVLEGAAYASLDKEGKSKGYIEGRNYIYSWAMGHLFREKLPKEINPKWKLFSPFEDIKDYAMPNLIPSISKIPVEDKFKERQRKILQQLINRKDIEKIINACDADDEGERIFYDIYTFLGGKKRNIEVLRFWNTGSYKSKPAVEKAMANLETGHAPKYKNLLYNNFARSNGDYGVGMKLTKVLCDFYGKPFYIGRVKGACIGIVGDREKEIENFVPETYWRVDVGVPKLGKLKHFKIEKNITVNSAGKEVEEKRRVDRFFSKDYILQVKNVTERDRKLTIVGYDEKVVSEKSKYLPLFGSKFTAIMMEKYKLLEGADKILDYLRNEGFTTYPGTNGEYFKEDEREEVKIALATACKYFGINVPFDENNEIFNTKKAEKQNHSPLSTTAKVPTKDDIKKWESEKIPLIKEGYEEIARHIISKFLPPAIIKKQSLIAKNSNNDLFSINGQRIEKKGWMEFMGENRNETLFDASGISKGSIVPVEKVIVHEEQTKKPSKHTVKSLLNTLLNVSSIFDHMIRNEKDPSKISEMKRLKKILRDSKGIGTDRTREGIIKDLFKNNIFKKNSKGEITLSDQGKELYNACPAELKSVIFTAKWEMLFEDIRRGSLSYIDFIKKTDGITMKSMIPSAIKKATAQNKSPSSSPGKSKTNNKQHTNGIIETPKTYRKDKLFLFKNAMGANLSINDAEKLLNGDIIVIKGKNKRGDFSAKIKMKKPNDGTVEVVQYIT